MASNEARFDVIVVGGGIAGLFAALCTFRVDFPAEDSAPGIHIVHRRGLPPAFELWL